MIRPFVTRNRNLEMARDRHESAVFAGTIVMHATRTLVRAQHCMGRGFVDRQMRSTCQVGIDTIDALEPRRDMIDMHGFAAVRGAGKGEFLVADAIGICRSRLDERQGLERFECRSRIDRRLDVAPVRNEFSPGIGHRDSATMPTLDQIAARDLDQNWVHSNGLICGPNS